MVGSPKINDSIGQKSLALMVIGPKDHWSEGALVRGAIGPKISS